MHGLSTIATQSPTQNQRALAPVMERTGFELAVGQFFRPCVLPFLALALFVGGWSYGYKLTQYLTHSDVTKASTTRMWVEHRDDGGVIAPAHHAVRPYKLLGLQYFTVATPQVPFFSRGWTYASPAQPQLTAFVSTLHPLRAPPISQISLA